MGPPPPPAFHGEDAEDGEGHLCLGLGGKNNPFGSPPPLGSVVKRGNEEIPLCITWTLSAELPSPIVLLEYRVFGFSVFSAAEGHCGVSCSLRNL